MNRYFPTKIQGARFGNGRNEWNFPTGVLKVLSSLIFLGLNLAGATVFAQKGHDWVSRGMCKACAKRVSLFHGPELRC